MLLKRSNGSRALSLVVLLSCLLSLGQAQTPSMSRQSGSNNEYQVGALLWTQSSAEYRALAYQTFVLARLLHPLCARLAARGLGAAGA